MGAIHRRHMITTDASMTGWGAVFEGRPASGEWKEEFLFLAYKLPGTQGCLPGFEVFSPRSRGASCHSQDGHMAVVSHITAKEVQGRAPWTGLRAIFSFGLKTSSSL